MECPQGFPASPSTTEKEIARRAMSPVPLR